MVILPFAAIVVPGSTDVGSGARVHVVPVTSVCTRKGPQPGTCTGASTLNLTAAGQPGGVGARCRCSVGAAPTAVRPVGIVTGTLRCATVFAIASGPRSQRSPGKLVSSIGRSAE